MKNSSLVKAFTLFGRKPFLLLLLLPMQVLPPAASKLLQSFDTTMLTPEDLLLYLLIVLLGCAAMLLMLLAGSVLLTPPAMELLRDGAAGAETEPGWYLRGLKKHWWKPVAIGAMEFGVNAAMLVVTYFVSVALTFIIMIPLFSAIPADQYASELPPQFNAWMVILLLAMFLPFLLYAVVSGLLSLLTSLLLPAAADRSLGKALKAVFSARGFRKLAKLLGVTLLSGCISAAVYLVFGAAYVLLTGIASAEDVGMGVTHYMQSWTSFFAVLFGTVVGLYRYSYSFCLMQEIRDEEAAREQSLRPAA